MTSSCGALRFLDMSASNKVMKITRDTVYLFATTCWLGDAESGKLKRTVRKLTCVKMDKLNNINRYMFEELDHKNRTGEISKVVVNLHDSGSGCVDFTIDRRKVNETWYWDASSPLMHRTHKKNSMLTGSYNSINKIDGTQSPESGLIEFYEE
jgi:hypothetical protein